MEKDEEDGTVRKKHGDEDGDEDEEGVDDYDEADLGIKKSTRKSVKGRRKISPA